MKTCTKCLKEKPMASFVKNKQCAHGVAGVCRDCMNIYQLEYKRANHERCAKRRRELYEQHYKPIAQAKEIQRRAEHPIRVRAQSMRNTMRERSKLLCIPFDAEGLSVPFLMEWLRSHPTCECCGKTWVIPPRREVNTGPTADTPTVDRFIPERGYVKSNIALLCWRCNNLKRDASAEELRRIADWMTVWGNETDKFTDLTLPLDGAAYGL